MVRPVLLCVPRWMACYQPGATCYCRLTQILLGTGGGGGTHSMVGFPQECAPVVCRDFAYPDLINRSSDLVIRFRLLCVFGGDDVSSLCVPPGLFDRALSQPALSDLGILVCNRCSL